MEQLKFETAGNNDFVTYTLLPEEILDQVTLGMMNNNTIKGLLPVHFLQVDDKQMLKYDISGRKALTSLLVHHENGGKIIRILKNLADSILNAKEYMIEESSFVFETDYVFVDVEEEKGQLLCLPVENRQGISFQEFCTQIVNQSGILDHLEYKFVSQLNAFLCGKEFSAKEFSLLLEKAELESSISSPNQGKDSREKGTAAGIVLGTNERNSLERKGQSIGMEGKRGTNPIVLTRNTPEKTANHGGTIFMPRKEAERKNDFNEADRTAYMTCKNVNSSSQLLDDEVTLYLLNRGVLKGYLIRESTCEKIEINKEEFCIGKSTREIDYRIGDNPTISRHHAKILQRGDTFWIVDMGSKNHTYVDKKAIESNQEIRLTDGARIRFSDEDFVFFIEK